nr:hypothetical protein GCM10020093_046720 [Planobispora longispora]
MRRPAPADGRGGGARPGRRGDGRADAPTSTDEGIQAATRLRRSHPRTGVVVLSQYAEPAYAAPLLAEGSAGRAYLLKERVGSPASWWRRCWRWSGAAR